MISSTYIKKGDSQIAIPGGLIKNPEHLSFIHGDLLYDLFAGFWEHNS